MQWSGGCLPNEKESIIADCLSLIWAVLVELLSSPIFLQGISISIAHTCRHTLTPHSLLLFLPPHQSLNHPDSGWDDHPGRGKRLFVLSDEQVSHPSRSGTSEGYDVHGVPEMSEKRYVWLLCSFDAFLLLTEIFYATTAMSANRMFRSDHTFRGLRERNNYSTPSSSQNSQVTFLTTY